MFYLSSMRSVHSIFSPSLLPSRSTLCLSNVTTKHDKIKSNKITSKTIILNLDMPIKQEEKSFRNRHKSQRDPLFLTIKSPVKIPS